MVIGAKCERCGRLATKDLKWVSQLYNLQSRAQGEELVCVCGSKFWKFVEVEQNGITPDILVMDEVALRG